MSKKHLDENSNIIIDSGSDDQEEQPRRKRQMTQRTESFSVCNHKQAVFQFNKEQIYELLLQHGVSIFVCDKLLCKRT